jgi:hypothetical protein
MLWRAVNAFEAHARLGNARLTIPTVPWPNLVAAFGGWRMIPSAGNGTHPSKVPTTSPYVMNLPSVKIYSTKFGREGWERA